MAIRKASRQYNSDYMSRLCDDELEQLEERLTALYANATNDVLSDYEKWMNRYEDKYIEMSEQLEAGEITESEFKEWVNRRMVDNKLFTETVNSMTDVLVNADMVAMALVNDELPLIIAQSYNFVQSLGFAAADEAGLSVGTFQIYNARTVQALIKDNPDILKYVNKENDYTFNKDRINNTITHSILNGDSIQKTANRLQGVSSMDENSAIRTARTAMTAAENLGRNEGFHDLKEKGIPARFQWSATHDGRTRDTHILLDGTYQDDNGYFGEGIIDTPIEYPGDPAGDPDEIYNCRCRASLRLNGVDHSQDGELYEKFMKENYPEDWSKVKEQREAKEQAYQENKTKAEAKAAEKAEEQKEAEKPAESVKEEEKKAEFIPAITVEEAQDRARELGAIYTKFDGWNLERANNALDALERLPAECRPKAVLNGKDTSLITQRPIGRKSSSWYGVTYDYRPFSLSTMQIGFDKTDYDGGQVVGINVQGFKTLEKLTEHKEKDNQAYFEKTGRLWYFNTDGEATAHHEMGHCFYNVLIEPNNSVRKEWDELATRWADESEFDMLKKPSEAFAEAWAGYNLDDERVPDYITDFIRRHS